MDHKNLLRHNTSFPNSSGSTDRPNTLGVQDAGADIFALDDFDSPNELAAIHAGCDMRSIGYSQNMLANLPVNRSLGNASAARSPSPHERPRSTLPIIAAFSSRSADDRKLFDGATSSMDARSSAVDDHMKRSQSRPLSTSVAGDPSPARTRARTFAKRSIDENPNLRRLEELYRDIAAQKEITARLGSSLRLHADELDDSLSGRSQSLSSTPPLFFPQEPSHSPSPSTSHSRDSPIQFISPRSPPVAGSAAVMPASSPDSPLGSSLVRPGGPTHASGRRPSIDSPSPLAAPPFESRTLRLSDAASRHSASSREPNCECETAEEAREEMRDERSALDLSLPAPPSASAFVSASASASAAASSPSRAPASASVAGAGGGKAVERSHPPSIHHHRQPQQQQQQQ